MAGDAAASGLWALLKAKRDDLIAEWSAATRRAVASVPLPRAELLDRMPEFVDQVIAALHPEAAPLPPAGENAEEHGAQRLRIGFNVAEVVEEYGLLHRCILEIADRAGVAITSREQRIIAHWLSRGLADAVGQYVKQRDVAMQRQTSEHFGFIAHELRNPVSTARLAFTRLCHAVPAVEGRWADVIDRNLRRTVDLIDGVLAQSSLDLGIEPALKRLDLEPFLHEIALDAATEAQSRGVRTVVSVEAGLSLDADARLLRSAVVNLVHNAVKFSRAATTVKLSATCAEGRLAIEVADGCGGLPPGKAEELFAPLIQRGDNRSGFGLGLAIALQATQAHHGTIKIHDVPGTGCVFTIDLPGPCA